MIECFNLYDSEYENTLKSTNYEVFLKVELLDHFEKTLYEITKEVSTDTKGSISITYQQGVRRTCSLTLRNLDKSLLPNDNSLIWINQKFKVWLGVKSSDKLYWWSQGVFVIKTLNVTPHELQIDGIDKFGFFTEDLNQHCLQGTYTIPYGTNVLSAIGGTLSMDMGNGVPIDPIMPIVDIEFINEVLPYDITKDADSYLGDILTELGTSLNADVYYDTHGHFIVTKSKIDTYPLEAPSWYFESVTPNLSNLSVTYNLGNIINVCKVYGTDVDGVIYSYIAKNTNPCSPTRISLIGEKSEKAEESDMCYDNKHCHDYAWYQLNQKSAVSMSISFNCPIIPHLDVNRIVSITSDYFDYYQENCLITSLTIPIGLDSMSVSACNIKYLPAYADSYNL
jgi:hypothetical protein